MQVSNSTPDFNLILNKQKSPKVKSKTEQAVGSGERAQANSDEQRISRKMAQTYLSGLSQGFVTNMDNLKLLNHQISAGTTGDGKSATTKSSGHPSSGPQPKLTNKAAYTTSASGGAGGESSNLTGK